jgi:RimJ/RimL family protein N-acetyltransferase
MDEALTTIASSEEAWDKGEYFSFAVFDTLGRLLGDVRLNRIDKEDLSANLGYWLRSSATGNGYAALAGRAAIAFGFQALALKRIELVVAISNLASQRCAERIGAQREGIARQRIFLQGQSEDAVVYSLISSDLA